MKIPTEQELEEFNVIRQRIQEMCAVLRCTPETLVDRIQALRSERESLTVEANEMKKQLEEIHAKGKPSNRTVLRN